MALVVVVLVLVAAVCLVTRKRWGRDACKEGWAMKDSLFLITPCLRCLGCDCRRGH